MRYPILISSLSVAVFALCLPAQVTRSIEAKKVTTGKTGATQEKNKVVAKQDKQGTKKATDGQKGTEKGKEKEKEKEEEIPIPAGADPADIAAIKSAQAMIKAERRLAKLLKAGKIKGIDRVLPFEEIASWPYEDALKGMPKKLKQLDGKKVMMTGFMLPIDEVENIKEFLLVQSLWSCCYGQPPDINGTVRVVMTGKKRTDYKFDPIKLVGVFRIKPTIEDGFCVDIYQLEIDTVEVIK